MAIRKQPNETSTFHYNNANPKNLRASDCAFRAISLFTGNSWDKVYTDLCAYGFKMRRAPNEKKVYEKYLDDLGYIKQSQPRKSDGTKYTVREFCKRSEGTILVSTANHLSCIVDGKVNDTWDCGSDCVGNYWKKNKESEVKV